jgi:S-methylmethionine-dependent homocysteine/selenocysteine methylase
VDTPLPAWSAAALETAPEQVEAIHADYVQAGATVHTTASFRTRRRTVGGRWDALTRLAVSLAQRAVGARGRVAGCIAPLADCYRPDLSPKEPTAEHREMAQTLADAGCDLLLCETFPHVGEALVAVEEAVATGLPTWVSFTAGPNADLLTPEQIARGSREAVARGASAVLVNCVPAVDTLRFIAPLATLGVPFGAYANAGHVDDRIGWRSVDEPDGVARYVEAARGWVDAGATVVGGCCGTGPAHVAALAAAFG